MPHNDSIAIYIHWPFCKSKCPYCDFNSHVRERIDQGAWQAAYLNALDYYAEKIPGRRVHSIFFGGGTPSLMAPRLVEDIIARVQARWNVTNDVEITLEANPTSVEEQKFSDFARAGVNRVSLGVQSLNDDALRFLGREHSAAEALKAVETARQYFERYSFDLMYGRPGQNLDTWRAELEMALPYVEGHMSLYQLTIERSTPFYMDHAQGKFEMPGEVLGADLYLLTQEIMEGAGLPMYEVSNHAKSGHESRHNLTYWRYQDYIGIGPGAHGRLSLDDKKYATREHSAPDIWLERALNNGCAHHPFDEIGEREQVLEILMMGLRVDEGVPLERLSAITVDGWQKYVDQKKLNALVQEEYVEISDQYIRLTLEGMMRLNAIIPYIMT